MNLRWLGYLVTAALTLAVSASAADRRCDVCGMTIADKARNHVVLKSAESEVHACSLSCVRKARKHDSKLKFSGVADFNHPEDMIQEDPVFFLLQSKKVGEDLGDQAMAPYVVGFKTRKEAEAARAKYGDGVVVEGAENAFK